MTQVFDPETGVVTSVTVIEAGPCPVVQVRTSTSTATRPSSSRSTRWPTGSSRSPSSGTSKARRRRRTGTSSSSAAPIDGAVEGETVTVEAFEPGDEVKVAGDRHRQGLPGHDQAPQLLAAARASHGSHNVRKPGSIGASATPSRVFKGIKMAGRMGGKRVTQLGLASTRSTPSGTCCSSRAPFRARRTGSSRSARRSVMAAPKAPLLDADGRRSRRTSRSTRPSSAPRSSRISSTRPCARS